jgi:hypothetical protein
MIPRFGFVVALGAVLVPPAVFGQISALWQPVKAEKPDSEKSLPIMLHPAPSVVPALKYQLLPPFTERRPGNAAVWWNRIPAERSYFFSEINKAGGEWEKIDKWMEIPLGDPSEKQHRPAASQLGGAELFADMERAARFESCDWELPMHEGGVIEMRLPELQQTRTYGRVLSAKARLEIAEGKYDQAVRTIQSGFALARDVAKGPCLINGLVGTAIASLMIDRIRELVQQPGSPNLYWALSSLPHPLIDYRLGFEAESRFLYLEFPELQDLDKKQFPPEKWRELLLKFVGVESFFQHADPLLMTGLAMQGYPQARQYLVEHGRTAAEVDAMPVAQVIVLYTMHVYDELAEEQFKWMFLPYAQAAEGIKQADRGLKDAIVAGRDIIPFATMLLPAVGKCKQAETRADWYVAQLRVLEALRLYADAHGRLPERLAEISGVPIPANPYDGKPFTYQRDGDKATLGCEQAGPFGRPWRLTITLAGKAK